MNKDNLSNIIEVHPRPMKWFRFYMKPFLIICMVFNGLAIISGFAYDTVNVVAIFNSAVYLVLSYFLFTEFKKLSSLAYKLVIIHVAYSLISLPILSLATSSLLYFDFYVLLGAVWPALIWFIPNFIYFKKRKEIFIF